MIARKSKTLITHSWHLMSFQVLWDDSL